MFERFPVFLYFFFFNDTATTEIYTLSLHDALPISALRPASRPTRAPPARRTRRACRWSGQRSEEHTSELQSHHELVCRLLHEKKKTEGNYAMRNVAHKTCYSLVVECVGYISQTFTNQELALGLIIFFFNDTATTEIYTLSLHDALPI